jgi:hypothetical protein
MMAGSINTRAPNLPHRTAVTPNLCGDMVDPQPCESYLAVVNVVIKDLFLLASKDKNTRIGDPIQTLCLTFSLSSRRPHRTGRAALQLHYRMRTSSKLDSELVDRSSDYLLALLSSLPGGNGTLHASALHLSSETTKLS